jgi:hypothetical protein
VHGALLVYSHDYGVAAYALKKDESLDPPATANELYWNVEGFAQILWLTKDYPYRKAITEWVKGYSEEERVGLFTHRTLSVACGVGHGRVHMVDEIGALPLDPHAAEREPESPLSWRLTSNELRAINLEGGKIDLRIGTYFEKSRTSIKSRVFLGPPLSESNRWFLIRETNRQIRVSSFSAERHLKVWDGGNQDEAVKAGTLWDTELLKSPQSIVSTPFRRIHAVHLVRAGDLVVCPTHLGRVVAVETKTGNIKWTHEYAPITAKRFETFAPEWVVVPPVVAGDKYIYAPADFPELLCLNVADGKKVWSAKKGDGLYPAVVGEQVLVIGEKTVRSLGLKDGGEQWKLDLPGLPCGRGALLGETYLVPVSEPKTWRGMIAVVDLKTGKIAEVLKPEKDEPIGNLVVHKDFLISQTLTEIAVFPIKKKE